MRIDRYSSEQFAGVRNHEVEFQPGMNVVLGDNETGKSTMIAAIYYALTQAAKLNKRTDSEFIDRHFPTSGAKTIDSTIRFTQDGKKYEVAKLWDLTGQDTGFKLRQIGGDTLRGSQAEDELKSIIKFGPSVYNNLIFGRQNHEDDILKWCYSFFAEKEDEAVDAVRKQIGSAVSAASGISPEKIMAEIEKRLSELGDRWDFDRDVPEKKTGAIKRWQNGVGKILEAWYRFEDADEACREAKAVEENIAATTHKLDIAKKEQDEAKAAQAELLEQKGAIENIANLQALKSQSERALQKTKRALADWPVQEQRIAEGKRLLILKEERDRKEKKVDLKKRIAKINSIKEEIEELQNGASAWIEFKADYERALDLEYRIELATAKLGGASFHATIKTEGSHEAQVDLGGRVHPVKEFDDIISGLFSMTIPGIVSVQVEPPDIDVKELRRTIEEAQSGIDSILDEYCVSDMAALGALSEELEEDTEKLNQKQNELAIALESKTLEDYINMLDSINDDPSIHIPNDLDELIENFLRGNRVLDVVISLAENAINNYQREYTSPEDLAETISSLESGIDDQQAKIDKLSIQSAISVEEFEERLRAYDEKLNALEVQIGGCQTALGQLGEPSNIGDLEAERDRLKEEWENLKRMHSNYLRIKVDFASLQAQGDDRFEGFHKKFNEYLTAIAGGRLTMDDDNGLVLTSGKNAVSKDILSTGTKKTLLLAFRLAVLSYYFPDGDGLVVLDDDLLDMDPDRRQQAANLLKTFAEDNQVIFTTCDPAIAELLGGNQVALSR